MKKEVLVSILIMALLLVSGAVSAEIVKYQPTMVAVVNPANWGIDNAIAGIIAVLGAYVAGLLKKKQSKRKKERDLGL